MKTYVATKNAGKLAEIRAIFDGSGLDIAEYPSYRDVAEDATSYIGNAMLKARALRAQLLAEGIWGAVLADDSGIEVDALHGRPGLLSARYAGQETTWPQRRSALLTEMAGVEEEHRSARFACVMALLMPGGEAHAAIGIVEGTIVPAERGSLGFGYDPVFFYPPLKRTFAELTPAQKNTVSHRRRAADALLASLQARV